VQKTKRFFLPAERTDISCWGIAALACGAVAVLAANLSFLLPAQTLGGLHTPYRENGSFSHIRTQLAELEQDRNRIAGDYRRLVTRFNMLHDDSNEAIRRLAAVEMSLPLLIEALPLESDIDRSLLTASITETAGEIYELAGGAMVVRYSALFDDALPLPRQPLPPPLAPEIVAEPEPETQLLGIAVGDPVRRETAQTAYTAVRAIAGSLLLDTAPLLADSEQTELTRIVFGPFPGPSSAQALCSRLIRLDLPCEITPYRGRPLPL